MYRHSSEFVSFETYPIFNTFDSINLRNIAVTQYLLNGLLTPLTLEINVLNLQYYGYFLFLLIPLT